MCVLLSSGNLAGTQATIDVPPYFSAVRKE